MDKDVNQFVGQRLYKALHTGKLSKRAQEVTGMPLINYNINYNNCVQKEPLKRTFSAFAGTTNTGKFSFTKIPKCFFSFVFSCQSL